MFTLTNPTALIRKLTVGCVAALLGASAALAGGGAGSQYMSKSSNANLSTATSQPPAATDRAKNDFGTGIADAVAIPFPLNAKVLSDLHAKALTAKMYLAGELGPYSRARTDAMLEFLVHYDAIVAQIAVIDIGVPVAQAAGNFDDADQRKSRDQRPKAAR